MADTHSDEVRSKNMSAIQSKNTKPELLIRKALHRRGIRYGLHNKSLPGTPDLHFRKYNAVLFVNGCFWHKHDCPRFTMPKSNVDYWKDKFQRNSRRDKENIKQLFTCKKRVAVLWECAIKGKYKLTLKEVSLILIDWLKSKKVFIEVEGDV